jgi:phage gp46-like protein
MERNLYDEVGKLVKTLETEFEASERCRLIEKDGKRNEGCRSAWLTGALQSLLVSALWELEREKQFQWVDERIAFSKKQMDKETERVKL